MPATIPKSDSHLLPKGSGNFSIYSMLQFTGPSYLSQFHQQTQNNCNLPSTYPLSIANTQTYDTKDLMLEILGRKPSSIDSQVVWRYSRGACSGTTFFSILGPSCR